MPTLPTSPRDLFGPAIGDCARIWRQKVNERLRPIGLSQASWLALLSLSHFPDGLIQGELAERLGIEGPTLVRLLDRLAADGLIERRSQPHDRRFKRVYLTDRAAPIVDQVQTIVVELRAEIMAGIPEETLRQGLQLLHLIRNRLTQA